jgi:hypothetical protein
MIGSLHVGPPEKCFYTDELNAFQGGMSWDLGNGGYSSLHVHTENGRDTGMNRAEKW